MTNLSSRNFRHLVTIGDVGGMLMADSLEGGSSVRQPWEIVFVARLDGPNLVRNWRLMEE